MKAKTIALAGMASALIALGGCMEKNVFKGEKEEEKAFNTFDYSTVNPATTLEVAYLNTGVKARVYFELYDEMPVIENEYSYSKRPDVTPLFAAYTDKDGVFKDNVQLPAYLKKVYIYSPAFYARTLIEAEVVNGNIQATDAVTKNPDTRTVAATDQEHDSYMVTELNNTPKEYSDTRWKTWLGEYDKKKNGEIKYQYGGKELSVESDDLYTAHSKVINVNQTCPEHFRSYTDLYVNKEAELAVTFLGQNTCWNCSLGYYYYKDGEKPASLNDAHVIMIFPNTQDGGWVKGQELNSNTYAGSSAGIDRGTAVQLKYYPNIKNGSEEGATTKFPAGLRIGFVLATNAWSNRIEFYADPSQQPNKGYRAATSEGLSVKDNGSSWDEPRTAVYKYEDHVMISFEDHTYDQNFSDVVITMKSNPVDAITDIPVVDPDDVNVKVTTLKGFYAFEDMWPARGDYDMNDVIVRYNYEKTFTKDNDNKIQSESFIFKTYQNYASLVNGLAFRVKPSGTIADRKYYIRKKGESKFTETTSFIHETDGASEVFLLTGDIRTDMGAEYKVTLEYDGSVARESAAVPFIYRASENNPDKRWEVHLPKENPTDKMDGDFFRKEDDASQPDKGIYYVRGGNYPFAIFLSGATETNMAKLLDRSNETVPIDQLYGGYNGWVTSSGNDNQDWYKE